MLPLVLTLLVAQLPCSEGEFSVVCYCKQGRASSCEAVRATNPKLADAIESALRAVRLEEEIRR